MKVIFGDITEESSDVIFNEATENMSADYGLSKLIMKKGGP